MARFIGLYSIWDVEGVNRNNSGYHYVKRQNYKKAKGHIPFIEGKEKGSEGQDQKGQKETVGTHEEIG